jgi:hypothetical protein
VCFIILNKTPCLINSHAKKPLIIKFTLIIKKKILRHYTTIAQLLIQKYSDIYLLKSIEFSCVNAKYCWKITQWSDCSLASLHQSEDSYWHFRLVWLNKTCLLFLDLCFKSQHYWLQLITNNNIKISCYNKLAQTCKNFLSVVVCKFRNDKKTVWSISILFRLWHDFCYHGRKNCVLREKTRMRNTINFTKEKVISHVEIHPLQETKQASRNS